MSFLHTYKDITDIDNNSDDDLIIADFSKDSITTKGIGFVTPKNYAVGDGPSFVSAAQLDDDGYCDLVVLNENSRSISILLNDGSGGFLTAASYPTTTKPTSATLADLDGDGDIDLAIANEGSYPGYDQKTFLNDGNGSFIPGSSLPASYHCLAVAAADLDDDADNDLIYVGSDSRFFVFINEGSGTFADSVVYEMSLSPFNIFVGDFDLDGDPDLALSMNGDGNIAVYYNDGNGVFGDPRFYRFGNADINGFAGADLDKDGDTELIAVSQTDVTDSMKIFWNRRDLIPTDIDYEDRPSLKPTRFALFQNFPNPFNPVTTIEYTVPVRAEVAITIYNILGQTVRSLTDGPKAPGTYRINWDGRDSGGHQVSTGIYFYQIKAGDFTASKRMILLK
ncbi:MAG: FG-GAP-like repeat-containing protein [candidate division Zixibacteria bacterium]|nr:FG-GAP-like repeat-containing protein [candidate division Zixibacteria bacterium]